MARMRMLFYICFLIANSDVLIVGKVVDIQFAPKRQYATTTDDLETVKQELEEWKNTLPVGMCPGSSEGNISVWSSLLHLSYRLA